MYPIDIKNTKSSIKIIIIVINISQIRIITIIRIKKGNIVVLTSIIIMN